MNGYKWHISSKVQKLIQELEILKRIFEKLPLPPAIIQIIRKKSFLNSAVSSAQIENIPSTIQSPRKEGKNLELAYNWVYSLRSPEPISIPIIRDLHRKVMFGLSSSAGQYRSEPWGVFDQAGREVLHAPLHIQLPKLMEDYCTYVNQLSDHYIIVAAVAQFIFEKLHPFADGNGRTGRLISFYLLHRAGYDLDGLVSLETYINLHRNWYYQVLEPSHNCDDFIGFFLEAMLDQANKTLEEIRNPPQDTPRNNLLPRRREMLEIISDHPECTFDFLQRRFMGVNSRALHRDVKYLQDHNLIEKLGRTRGAVYIVKS